MLSNHKYFQWYYSNKNKHALFNIGTTLFIWIFLFIAKPFGIGSNNVPSEFLVGLYLMIFAMTWTAISYFTDFSIRILESLKFRYNPITGLYQFLIKIVLLVHSILIIRLMLCNWSCIDHYEYVEIWFAVGLMIGISYLIYTLHAKHLYFKSIVDKSNDDSLLVLNSSGKYQFKKPIDTIVYLKSEDNYIKIVYLDENQILKSELVRLTLASAEKQLLSYTQFSRIHRSYIVNLKFLKARRVNDSGTVNLEPDSIKLPVSRTFKKALMDKIGYNVGHK